MLPNSICKDYGHFVVSEEWPYMQSVKIADIIDSDWDKICKAFLIVK